MSLRKTGIALVIFLGVLAALGVAGFARAIPATPGSSGYHVLNTISLPGTQAFDTSRWIVIRAACTSRGRTKSYLVSGRNVHGNSRPELQQVPETAFRVFVVGK